MIRRIHVRNFKSLRDVELQLGLRNVVVGPNMSGKSTLIDVVRFLSRMILPAVGTYGLPNAVQTFGGFSEVSWKGDTPSTISIALEGDYPARGSNQSESTWSYEISILGDPRGSITVQRENLAISTPRGSYRLIETSETGRSLQDRNGKSLTHVGAWDRSALEFEIPDWEGNFLRQLFTSFRFYRLFPPLMKQVNQTAAAKFLMEHGENLSSWMMTIQTQYSESFERIRQAMRDVFPQIENIFTVPTQQATVVVASREKYLRREVAAWQMSDGELAFLALVSLIFSPRDLGAPLYCVEEPENHLHPGLLETLVQILKQVQDDLPSLERSQILLTTHSPHLVDQWQLDELIVVERFEGATICTRPRDKTHLRSLLEREQAGLGDLFYSGALGSAPR